MTCPQKTVEDGTTHEDAKGWWKTRYTYGLLSMLALANVFAMRVNLSVAIVAMVNFTALAERSGGGILEENGSFVYSEDETCPGEGLLTNDHDTESMNGAFLWDEQKQGEVLAAYFYGYTLGHIPGGMMADRFGGKLLIGLAVFITAITTLATPPLAWISAELVFAARFIQGLGQGGQVPAIQSMMAKWVPQQERGKFSVAYFGTFVGVVLSMALTGVMCETAVGWPLSFYFFGALGLIWCVPWFLVTSNSPAEHPRIDPAERAYIEASVGGSPDRKRLEVPWRHILLSSGFWGCTMVQLGIGWEYYLVQTSLPLYLANILKFDLHSNGVLSAIPYISGGVASLLVSWGWQAAVKSNCMSRLNLFRVGNAVTVVLPAVMIVGVALVGCDWVAVVVMLIISTAGMAVNYTCNYNNLMVLAPNYSGSTMGIANTFANATGIFVPYVVAAFTNRNQTRSAWNSVFYLSAAVGVVTYLAYLVLSTDKEEPWNDPSYVAGERNKKKGQSVGEFDGPAAADGSEDGCSPVR